jgi:HEAT repeat protein
MANRKIEEQIESLRALRDGGPTAESLAALRKALAGRTGMVVAQAAKIAGEFSAAELIPDLLEAFERLFEKPVERDPQCWGKNAIARALTALDYRGSGPFLRGLKHVQMEPVWGGQEDTASALRGICVLGLASCTDVRREEILRPLVDRLTDQAYTVRIEAARALAQMGGDDSALLLRLKARTGDAEPRVTGQVLDALLEVECDAAIDFVRDILQHGAEAEQTEAALSLGSSRLPGAGVALQEAWNSSKDPELRLTILRALSASRQEPALEFLLDLVKQGRARDAEAALEALALHKESEEIRSRAAAAARESGAAAEDLFRKIFR